MPRAKAAQRVAAQNVTATLAALLSPARAEASRKNGASSKGPVTPEGKARSAQNALKHGLRAEKHVVVGGESPAAFTAFEAALLADLAPEGALQTLLAGRIARAAWRLERAERIEAELFARQMKGLFDDGDLGLALIRDGNGARAFDTLLRYRGAAQAELFRTLRTLRALQAEPAKEPAPVMPECPIEPEIRRIPGNCGPAPVARDPARAAGSPRAGLAPRQPPYGAAPAARPNEAESRANPGESVSMPRETAKKGRAALLAATALVPPDCRSST
jgi:hypothetical protein